MTSQERVLLAQIRLQQGAARLAERCRARVRRTVADERGQTPTEYLMIVGLMAAVVVIVFVTLYWGQVRDAAGQWVEKVRNSILGTEIN